MHGEPMSYPTNRDRRLEPRQGSGCCACDRAIVRGGQRCPICRQLMKRRRLKKTPLP